MTAENPTCTRATQMAIAVSSAAAGLSDLARAMVAPGQPLGHGDLAEDAQAIVDRAHELLRLAVAAERCEGATWREIGTATRCGIQDADTRFADDVRNLDKALIEYWLDTAAGDCPAGADLPPAAADPVGTARWLDGWVDAAGRKPVSDSLRYVSDGDHAYMISAAHQLLTQLQAAGTDPARLRELEYGYLHRSAAGYERMLNNPTFSRGREAQMQDRLAEVRARIAEQDEERACQQAK